MNIQTNTPTEQDTRVTEPQLQEFVPATDIHETGDSLVIRCDLPGVAEEDLEINLDNRTLTISGRQQALAEEGFQALTREYPTGIYQRSFRLGRDLDEAAVKARLRNGVLEIELPKAAATRARRIPVES